MEKSLASMASHLEAVTTGTSGLSPDDLQGIVALMDLVKEVVETGREDPSLEVFCEVGEAIDAALTMLILFQIEGEDAKRNAVDLVIRATADLKEVVERKGSEPDFRGQAPKLLGEFSALTGQEFASIDAPPETAAPAEPNTEDIAPAPAAAAPVSTAPAEESTTAQEDEPLLLDPSLEGDLVAEFVAEAMDHLETIEDQLLNLEANPEDMEAVNAAFRPFHSVKGASGFLQLMPINHLAHDTETLLDRVRSGTLNVTPALVEVFLESGDLISRMIAEVGRMHEAGETTGKAFQVAPLLKRINAALNGEEIPQAAPAKAKPADAKPAEPKAEPAAPAEPKAEAVRKKDAVARQLVRVNANNLTSLINLVGELVISGANTKVIAQRIGDGPLLEAMENMLRLVNDIRDTGLGLRMVEIGETFAKFRRVVRDAGNALGKDIELVISGGDTELDKTVVEKIGDPLMHLVRNAVDHGIEPPEVRQMVGKDGKGTIQLNAYHDSGSIVVEIVDDGRGLCKERILEKALERGLIRPDQQLSDNEIFRLIFEAGFSTAEQVTDISGRGVGMDVVRRNINALRGQVDVESIEGKGSKISIRLPLTLAIIDGFQVRVGGSYYVVPLDMVVECVELGESGAGTRGECDYINLRGEVLPFVRLGDLFEEECVTDRREDIVVVQVGGKRAGLVVDELLGEYQTVIKPLGKIFQNLKCVSGATILGSGDVALILDVPALVEEAVSRSAARVTAPGVGG